MTEKYNLEMYRQKAELCKTFSDPTRLMIISELRSGEKSVGELVDALQLPQAVISRHLAVLRHRGAVKARREGASRYYSLSNPKIVNACDLVQEILLEQAASNKEMADKLTRQAFGVKENENENFR